MVTSAEFIIGVFLLPVLLWVGVILFIRTLTGEISQIQITILFTLALFLIVSFVMLNIGVSSNLTLLAFALIETVTLAGTVGLFLKKVVAKQ